MNGIHKRFGAVAANIDVELRVAKGSIHGIVGENGAGKSTLMSILYGLYQADSGYIKRMGHRITVRNANDAIAHGIGMVHQHFMLVDTLSALDNVMLGAEPHWLLTSAQKKVRRSLDKLMQSTGLQVRLNTLVRDLPVGERQRLEILKTLYRGAEILILDEPTAVLTPQETEQLFKVLRTLREQGTTILLITHKLKEVMQLCDQVTVMRAGRVTQETPIAQASIEILAQAMVGRSVNVARVDDPERPAIGDIVLRAQGLRVVDALKVVRLENFNLELRAGEIVGIAGVSGNGQSEALEVLSGLLSPQQGKLQIGTHTFRHSRWLNPRTARQLGLAHVPEDRHARAMVMDFAAWESAVLGYDGLPTFNRWGWMRRQNMRKITANLMQKFDIRPKNPMLLSGKFSGGNQQKLVLAREMGVGPKVLLVGQPTRGVDIGAIEFIYNQLREMRDAGCAIVVVSSELDEILALADRIIVMHQSRVSGTLAIADCTEAKLAMLMSGASL